jgi:heme/copper-type cytochrome/quinol oxidase subunit 2
MSTDKLLELLFTALPTIIVAVLAYFFFQNYFENENRRRRYVLHKDAQKSTLPLRLQAYERLSLF